LIAITDAELRAVFGRRADYYLAQWHGTAQRRSNWAAFFFSALWLAFRRMYLLAVLLFGVVFAVSILEQPVFSWLGHADVPRVVDRAVDLVLAITCGASGNRWYFAHVRRLVARTRALALPEEAHLHALVRRGGTRVSHAVAFLLGLLGLVLALALVESMLESGWRAGPLGYAV
jgi:Protein of unknown function (DUF2628)